MAEENPFDIEEPSANSDTFKRMVSMAEEVVDTEQLVAELEDNLETVKKTLNRLKTKDLPDLMAEVGVTEIAVKGGIKVEIKDFVAGSLPKASGARKAAIDWIAENDGEDLIRTVMRVEFEKSEHNIAMDIAGQIREKGYEPVVESGVHPQTLLSFVREKLEDGDEVPLEKLGLYAGRTAKVKVPKEKKGKKQ
jgi:hypothetical protein